MYWSCLAQMHTHLIAMVEKLLHCIQVPEQHWADNWHYKETGFDIFAEAFALGVVSHLRERGMVVEGSGLLSRA